MKQAKAYKGFPIYLSILFHVCKEKIDY